MTAIPWSMVGAIVLPEHAISPGAGGVGLEFPPSTSSDASVTRGLNRAFMMAAIQSAAREAAVADWDANGARPVEPTTIAFAKQFAAALPPYVPLPDVSADSDGDLSFDWNYGPRRVFSVSVRRDGVLNYAGLFGGSSVHGSETIFAGLPAQIVSQIARVAAA